MDLSVQWWDTDPDLLSAVRGAFAYGPGEDRATGYLFGDGRAWPEPLAVHGAALLARLLAELGVAFTHVAFQAYRNGSGCDWHTDSAWDTQAILSLGVGRTFGVRMPGSEPIYFTVDHGDLMVMPSGFQDTYEHCVPVEDAPGERVSLVFRTPRS